MDRLEEIRERHERAKPPGAFTATEEGAKVWYEDIPWLLDENARLHEALHGRRIADASVRQQLAETGEELEDLRRELRRFQLFVEECWKADEFLHPINNPFSEQEEHWNERGWEFDGFGTWAPPGYHIVRPGKTQKNDY